VILDIVKYPDPILRKVAKPVEKVDMEIQKLIEDMYETMYAAPGVGLAAPQVAVSKRILVIDVGLLEKDALGKETHTPDPKAIINPIVTIQEGKILWDEGCLSMPNLIVPVERSKKILVEGLDREGKKVKYLGEDLLAVAFQHEIDHLDGKLIFDKLSRLKQDLYKKKLARNERPEPEEEIEHGSGPTYVG
jgi:peptide deformylase